MPKLIIELEMPKVKKSGKMLLFSLGSVSLGAGVVSGACCLFFSAALPEFMLMSLICRFQLSPEERAALASEGGQQRTMNKEQRTQNKKREIKLYIIFNLQFTPHKRDFAAASTIFIEF